MHQIIGAGSNDKVCDLGNVLKPALARGELTVIGATTPSEYKVTIERDTALDRRFNTVMIDPPSLSESVDILEGLKSRFEVYHNVKYDADVSTAIVHLTDRFIPLRNLPDKAISVLDAVGAQKRIFCDLNKESSNLITIGDVRDLISKRTKIPDFKLEEGIEKINKLESFLKEKIIGQDKAVKTITDSLMRSYAGLKDVNRPLGSFLFLGSTGTGKTQTCKMLADHLFGSKDNLIQIDMTEFASAHSSEALLGSPPGYIGFEKGGRLTEEVKKKPYSIILFDEIEKAHQNTIQLLLQLLEEGKLTDRAGISYNFKNCIIVMTSNLGSDILSKSGNILGFSTKEIAEQNTQSQVLDLVKKQFTPEFANRIDEIVIFNKLTKENISKILLGIIEDYRLKIFNTYKLNLTVTSEALDYFCKVGYNENFGARELKRVMYREFETPISYKLLQHKKNTYSNLKTSLVNDKLVFEIN